MSFPNCMNVSMNENELRKECQVALDRVDVDMVVDQRSETKRRSVSADATARCTQGEGEMPPPGPACSKARHAARTRSASSTPGASLTSKATAALMANRKSQRQAALDSNRFAVLAAVEQGDENQSPICIDSDESEEDAGYAEKGKPPLKRRKVRRMTSRQVLANHAASVEDKLDELGNAPTVDLAQRARDSMVEVWKIASISKNLKGDFVKELKQAAAVGAASTELLSQRVESNDSESDALRQIKILRKELEQAKCEARAAKEEAERVKREMEKLRKELTEAKGSERPKRRVRTVIEDSPPPRQLQERKWRWTTPLQVHRVRRRGDLPPPPRRRETLLNIAMSGGKQRSCRHPRSGRTQSALRYGGKRRSWMTAY